MQPPIKNSLTTKSESRILQKEETYTWENNNRC